MHSVTPGNCFFCKGRSNRSFVHIQTVIFNLHRLWTGSFTCSFNMYIHRFTGTKNPPQHPYSFCKNWTLQCTEEWYLKDKTSLSFCCYTWEETEERRIRPWSWLKIHLSGSSIVRCHHTVDIPATTGKKNVVLKDNEWIKGRGAYEEKREGGEDGSFWDSRKQFQFSLKTLSIYSQLSERTPR